MKKAQAELTTRITELQQENQFLRETKKKMQYDPCNPKIEENEIYEEVYRPKAKQPRQKTPIARPMKIPHLVEGVARSL